MTILEILANDFSTRAIGNRIYTNKVRLRGLGKFL